jgi:endonuclease III
MSQHFHNALERVENVYNSQAQQIWSGNPNCATVIRRFLEFDGVGSKIANMATNILLRDFKVPMQNINTIDMPVDSNVERVFKRLHLVQNNIPGNKTKEIIAYTAKSLYPDYPAVFDKGVWEIGKYWCHAKKRPDCVKCYMHKHCPSAIF